MKTANKIIILLLFTTFLPISISNSQKKKWVEVEKNDIGDSYFYNPNSIKLNNKIISALILINLKNPIQMKSETLFFSILEDRLFDCSKSAYQTKKADIYQTINANGKSKQISIRKIWEFPVENSADMKLINVICKNDKFTFKNLFKDIEKFFK